MEMQSDSQLNTTSSVAALEEEIWVIVLAEVLDAPVFV